MADLTEAEFDAANERGRIEFETQPHAASAHYDAASGLMTLQLYNGCAFTFPPRQLQGLASATDEQLAQFELSGVGFGLHWEALNADFTVPGLLAGQFGTRRFMEAGRARLRALYDQQLGARADWNAEAAE